MVLLYTNLLQVLHECRYILLIVIEKTDTIQQLTTKLTYKKYISDILLGLYRQHFSFSPHYLNEPKFGVLMTTVWYKKSNFIKQNRRI